MRKKASDFDDFLIATILADLFDPSGSDNLDFVSKKIINGLIENGIMKIKKILQLNFFRISPVWSRSKLIRKNLFFYG